MKKALITGANGQDASFLAELLLQKDYKVYGTIRRNSVPESQTTRISSLRDDNKIELVYADLVDPTSVDAVVNKIQPDELYHLAAQSHVRISFDLPNYTTQTNAIGTLNVLEAVRKTNKQIKIYNAASSEMFGNSFDDDLFQRETTPMHPVSPYGCSKLFAYNLCNNYKQAYNMFISSGILFNHESYRRGINFVTNKVVHDAVQVSVGKKKKIRLGNLEAQRDWGHAKDYVKAMWLMLQQYKPDNFVIATGETHSVRFLVEYVLSKLNLKFHECVEIDPNLFRPEELKYLKGDCSFARKSLGWKPEYTFESMIDEMIDYWCNKYRS